MHSLRIQLRSITTATCGLLLFTSCLAAEVIVDFEDYPLDPESSFHGPDPNGVVVPGDWGSTVVEGSFSSGGVTFLNSYNQSWDSWSGFAVSNMTNTTTQGVGNQFSAYTGTGAGSGNDNYTVAFGYHDLVGNMLDPIPFDSLNVDHLWGLPSLMIPTGFEAVGTMITNTTYSALSMMYGDGFSKAFGGDSKDDPDFFKLSVFGIDAFGNAMGQEIEFYLADYRFEDNSLDYILDEWVYLDLTDLAGATSLHFNLSSSDPGEYGMNTPSYFAMDNLTLQSNSTAVPEPATLSLLALSGVLGGVAIRRRSRSEKAKSAV